MRCKTTKESWYKLKIIYEGESKVKESKLQTYKGQFESLKMKEEENIGEYLLRVDEVVNVIVGDGWGIDVLMQRDGALIGFCPCGSTNGLMGFGAGKAWLL